MDTSKNKAREVQLLCFLDDCGIVVGEESKIQPGKLSVDSNEIVWVSKEGNEIVILHQQISMHGINRNTIFKRAGILTRFTDPIMLKPGNESEMVYFFPREEELQSLFHSLNKGLDLNPDLSEDHEYTIDEQEEILAGYEEKIQLSEGDREEGSNDKNGQKLEDCIIDPKTLNGIATFDPNEGEEGSEWTEC